MTPKFLAWANERMELPFTEMRKTVGTADVEWGLGVTQGVWSLVLAMLSRVAFKRTNVRCEMSSWIYKAKVLGRDLAEDINLEAMYIQVVFKIMRLFMAINTALK